MRIGIIGRTRWLLESAQALRRSGHEIAFVITAKAAEDYDVKEADFENYAREVDCPFLLTQNVNRSEVVSWMAGQGAVDLAVSINFTGIVGGKVIRLFRHGVLNAHGGDLPRYRGNACQAWALINGEDRIGLCVHRMVANELDSGDILARDYLKVDADTRIGEVYEWMNGAMPVLMDEAVARLEADPLWKLEVQSKDPADVLRCYPRMPGDGKLSWTRPRLELLRLINASSEPYSGAFSFLGSDRVILWRAELPPEEKRCWLGVPGQITEIHRENGWIEVLCHDGKLRITEIERGGKRQPPAEVIRSIRTRFTDNPPLAL